MSMKVTPDYPVHELITKRWSPYGFDERPVSAEDLRSLFEAARWAPSSYNEQPWRYLLATKDAPREFERMLSCLVETNQRWAKVAPVLVLGVASLRLARHDRPNRAALHDLGLAAGNLLLEATARGLFVHQMIGIIPDRVRQLYGIPEDFEPLTALAIGYPAPLDRMPVEFQERDRARRPRKPSREFVFSGRWGSAAPLFPGGAA